MSESNDHDKLIEIGTIVRLWHEESSSAFVKHTNDDMRNFTELDSKISAAHRRMDEMKVEQSLGHKAIMGEIKALSETTTEKIENLLSMKDKVLGGAFVVMFIVTTGISVFSIFKK